MASSPSSKKSPWIVTQSVVVGLSCGVGFYLAREGWCCWPKKRFSQALSKLSHVLTLSVTSKKNLWETTVPWWLVLATACPSPWYPLALWFIMSTSASTRSEDEQQHDDDKQDHSDPLSPGGKAKAAVTTTVPTKESTLYPPCRVTHTLPTHTNEPGEEKSRRYLEMLVHNVSHTDLVLSVDAPPPPPTPVPDDGKGDNDENNNTSPYCLCAPRFSAFDMYCRRILQSLSGEETVVSFPRYERSETSPRYAIVTPKPSRQGFLPTGLALLQQQQQVVVDLNANADCQTTTTTTNGSLELLQEELSNLRFRGRDAHRIEPYYYNAKKGDRPLLHLSHVFFPLLATLLPKWQSEIEEKFANYYNNNVVHVKKVIVLVSGVGTPRNWTHSISGNSTQACAELMERFIHVLHPDVTVVRIHSDTNIFRYDENIVFVKRELMPRINAYRDAHARGLLYPDEQLESPGGGGGDGQATTTTTKKQKSAFSTDWKQSFSVTLSFSDGAHARTHAIQTSLRSYRPRYFHLWQLKTFWHDAKIVQDDLEVHSFEDMETVPAMDVSRLVAQDNDDNDNDNVKLVVNEMNAFKTFFLESLLDGDNDVSQFWLRKTKKPVLAVLLVSGKDGKPLLYRGTNMEVSMPTGSLCAERNVIGTALASNPSLKREDLRMVAVLAVPLDIERNNNNMRRSSSLASYSSIQEEETGWVLPTKETTEAIQAAIVESKPTEVAVPVHHAAVGSNPPSLVDLTPRSTPPGTPVRRITLYSQGQETQLGDQTSKPVMGLGRPKQRKTVLVHSAEDLNPLRPCGSCNEWLKKIAESNPYFKVLTFTDVDCNGIYVSPCQE